MVLQPLLHFIHSFIAPPSPEPSSPERILSETEQKLCRLVTQQLTVFFENQRRVALFRTSTAETTSPEIVKSAAPRKCILIFRQTKSWTSVEEMLRKIVNSDEKIKEWVLHWKTHISTLRTMEEDIQNSKEKLRIIQQFSCTLSETEEELRAGILCTKSLIKKRVEVMQQDLNLVPDHVLAFRPCNEVFHFLKNNWSLLTVFSEWSEAEISLNDEIIVPQICEQNEKAISSDFSSKKFFKQFFRDFPCTKAIFYIEDKATQRTETSVTREHGVTLRDTILKTTRFAIAHKYLAPASPHPSAVELSDDSSHDVSLATSSLKTAEEEVESVSRNAMRLRIIVSEALKELNGGLSRNNKKTRSLKAIRRPSPVRDLFSTHHTSTTASTSSPTKDAGDKENKEA